MKTVCVVTGTRAEYGLSRPLMRRIAASDSLHLQILVSGVHLRDVYGETYKCILADGFHPDAYVPLELLKATSSEMGSAVGHMLVELSHRFEELRPDVVVVLGDRIEAFAAAAAAVFAGICLAHVHGGDRTRGGFDESMRHAITKLAHVHFAATEKSAERIRNMGERPEHVHVVGAPGLDEALAGPLLDRDELGTRLGIDLSTPPIVVLQHPVSTRSDHAADEMTETMEAVVGGELPVIVIHPNNDAGGRHMIAVIKTYEVRKNVTTFPSIPRTAYLSLLGHASVLVGNSSSGVIEAPSFKLPVVNVGERQAGRERARNVIDVPPEREAIAAAIHKALHDKDFRQSLEALQTPYGDGHASERIVAVLEKIDIDHDLIQKQIAY